MTTTPDDIATTLALVAQRLDSIERTLEGSMSDHETRLRKLEQWSYALPASLVLAAFGVVFGILNHK